VVDGLGGAIFFATGCDPAKIPRGKRSETIGKKRRIKWDECPPSASIGALTDDLIAGKERGSGG